MFNALYDSVHEFNQTLSSDIDSKRECDAITIRDIDTNTPNNTNDNAPPANSNAPTPAYNHQGLNILQYLNNYTNCKSVLNDWCKQRDPNDWCAVNCITPNTNTGQCIYIYDQFMWVQAKYDESSYKLSNGEKIIIRQSLFDTDDNGNLLGVIIESFIPIPEIVRQTINQSDFREYRRIKINYNTLNNATTTSKKCMLSPPVLQIIAQVIKIYAHETLRLDPIEINKTNKLFFALCQQYPQQGAELLTEICDIYNENKNLEIGALYMIQIVLQSMISVGTKESRSMGIQCMIDMNNCRIIKTVVPSLISYKNKCDIRVATVDELNQILHNNKWSINNKILAMVTILQASLSQNQTTEYQLRAFGDVGITTKLSLLLDDSAFTDVVLRCEVFRIFETLSIDENLQKVVFRHTFLYKTLEVFDEYCNGADATCNQSDEWRNNVLLILECIVWLLKCKQLSGNEYASYVSDIIMWTGVWLSKLIEDQLKNIHWMGDEIVIQSLKCVRCLFTIHQHLLKSQHQQNFLKFCYQIKDGKHHFVYKHPSDYNDNLVNKSGDIDVNDPEGVNPDEISTLLMEIFVAFNCGFNINTTMSKFYEKPPNLTIANVMDNIENMDKNKSIKNMDNNKMEID